MAVENRPADQANQRTIWLWKSCLNAAFRTALACTLVGLATLYGPASIKAQIAFPAFSYVTVILVVTNATLGDAVRGCWFAVYATVQGVCPAILCLWIIGPTRLNAVSTAVVLGISAFFIVLPEWSHVVAKRIALGQLVIVYVIGYINGGSTEPVMHPVHVATSTAVGVVACVIALLLPFPYLASSEVKQSCKMFADNASNRLKLFTKAFCAEDKQTSHSLLSQAKSLASSSTKILQSIKSKQESMKWERLPIKFFKSYCMNPGDKFQKLETLLKGMEMALTSSKFPVTTQSVSEEFKNGLKVLEESIGAHLNQIRAGFNGGSTTVPESSSGPGHVSMEFLQTLQTTTATTKEDLPSLFFLFCLNLLQRESKTVQFSSSASGKPDPPVQSKEGSRTGFFSNPSDFVAWPATLSTKNRVFAALKCSLSLGLAVLFGLIYSKENGFWAGLPVAISLAAGREATFKIANVKAQGTVLGTVYGVLGCFVFERFVQIRFLALLPWFIVTSFLQKSKLYGQAGAVSAVIGAVLILGRRSFGTPSDFAIARIIETFIGLTCSVAVELVLQPTRAASLAKSQLSKTLGTLRRCLVTSMNLQTKQSIQTALKSDINELQKFIEEAEQEPNFWFLPFNCAGYRKMLCSMSKMADLLLFASHAIASVELQLERLDGESKEWLIEKMNTELEKFRKLTVNSVTCFEEISSMKSLSDLEKKVPSDLEMGKISNSGIASDYEDEMERIMNSFLDRVPEVVSSVQEDGGKEEMVLSMSGVAFCMNKMMKGTKEIEMCMKEIVQWENPSRLVNLNEIYCKLHAFDV
ncbi:hypothetical protein V2J09_019065 [Rumex salicifolius]